MVSLIDGLWLLTGLGVTGGLGWWLGRSTSRAPEAPATIAQPSQSDHSASQDSLQDGLLEQLQQTQLAYQMATEMSQFKAGFLARTSHELRSPLNGLLGMHQLILSDLCDSPEEERDFVAQAHTSAMKMVKILDEILEVAKLEHGTQQLDIQPLQLSKVLSDAYQFTHLQAQNRNLRLHILPVDPDLYILADPNRFRQILISLIDQPIALMSEGNIQVSVHTDFETGYAHIWIEDDRPNNTWSEPLDLLKRPVENPVSTSKTAFLEKVKDPIERSTSMTLLMIQAVLELMNGRLEVLAVPPTAETAVRADNSTAYSTRVQCSIPLIVPEPD